jgi:hypothetical protein
MYTRRTDSTNYQNKTFVRTEQIIWTATTTMYTCGTNLQSTKTKHLHIPNKLYELLEQICIHVKWILQIAETKNLYVTNKLYEQIIEEEQIFTKGK